jgi:hypothetical protein
MKTMRPTVPDIPNFEDSAAVKVWNDAKRAAYLWDAIEAGFTETQAAFLWSQRPLV